MRRWLEYTPRGDSLDPLRLRWATWVVVARSLPGVLRRHPFGRRPLGRDLRAYMAATGAVVHADHAFNEYLEVVYEWGLVGLVWCGLLGVYLAYGPSGAPDFSRAVATWALTMMGSITLRTWPFPLVGALLLLGAWQ